MSVHGNTGKKYGLVIPTSKGGPAKSLPVKPSRPAIFHHDSDSDLEKSDEDQGVEHMKITASKKLSGSEYLAKKLKAEVFCYMIEK